MTLRMFEKAGLNVRVRDRSYRPTINDDAISCILLRAQEIPKYIQEGVLDAGIAGKDWMLETRAKVVEVADLPYTKTGLGKMRLVIAVPNASRINEVADLEGKRIATELVNVTKGYLSRNGVKAKVEFSWGATEAKAPELCDAISELTETGSSLRANNLRIVSTILESTTRFMANKQAMLSPWKRSKIEELATLLRGAVEAESKVGLKLNVNKGNLDRLLSLLPSLKKPTISPLSDGAWVAVEIIVDKNVSKLLIPKLKNVGAQGIVEYPLNMIIE